MKRYDLDSDCLCGVGYEPLREESPEGYWVEADVAQELYDSLSGFIDAVDEDVIRVRPSDRDKLLSLLERANTAIYMADKG